MGEGGRGRAREGGEDPPGSSRRRNRQARFAAGCQRQDRSLPRQAQRLVQIRGLTRRLNCLVRPKSASGFAGRALQLLSSLRGAKRTKQSNVQHKWSGLLRCARNDDLIRLDQRAAALVERTERFVAGDGGEQLVEIPFALRLFRLLDL